jgi:hypothetical protein
MHDHRRVDGGAVRLNSIEKPPGQTECAITPQR